MQLLVSVRSAAEVEPALSGGADIIDAKEPSRGSLGAVAGDVLDQIVAHVPHTRTVSVALGDLVRPDEIVAAVSLGLAPRPGSIYLKVGFAGESSVGRIERLMAMAIEASGKRPAAPRIVAVAYADAARAGTASPDTICRLAARTGAAGILLDTQIKDGRGLLQWIEPAALRRWVVSARGAGLLTALAGGLGLEDMELVATAEPDVVGVRGAACEGGRAGHVDRARVRALHERLSELDSGFLQE
jgi:uncharacterized protein (UPF0264 family)